VFVALCLQVVKNDDLPPPPTDDDTDNIIMPPSKMSINVSSQDALNLTVTKTCLEVLQNLGKVRLVLLGP
jgi:hypothetical protein